MSTSAANISSMDGTNVVSPESAYKAWSEFDPSAHVRELSKTGANVAIDSNITPARYIRAMNQMEKTSHFYLKEGKHEEAYVLLNKLVTIFVEKLPTHPSYKTLDSKSRAEASRIIKRAFPIAEEMKTKLMHKYLHLKESSLRELEQQLASLSSTESPLAGSAAEQVVTAGDSQELSLSTADTHWQIASEEASTLMRYNLF